MIPSSGVFLSGYPKPPGSLGVVSMVNKKTFADRTYSVTVSWLPAANEVVPYSYFEVFMRLGAFESPTWTPAASCLVNSTTNCWVVPFDLAGTVQMPTLQYTFSNLSFMTKYHFAVIGYNPVGASNMSDILSVTTGPVLPTVPLNLTLVAKSSTSIVMMIRSPF